MKLRRTQFGARENTASIRQHASRLAVSDSQSQSIGVSRNLRADEISPHTSAPISECEPSLTEAANAATVGEESLDNPLLTVDDVARSLKVHRSWVYERTRRRGRHCLPHIKLGKYLRFEVSSLRRWLAEQRIGDGILSNESRRER